MNADVLVIAHVLKTTSLAPGVSATAVEGVPKITGSTIETVHVLAIVDADHHITHLILIHVNVFVIVHAQKTISWILTLVDVSVTVIALKTTNLTVTNVNA